MATLLDSHQDPNAIFFSVPITSIEKSGDDSVLVHGKVTNDNIDLDDQIIDKDFSRSALQKWFTDYANVRQMHSTTLPPGGKGVKLEEKPDGFYLTAKVVEPVAMKLCNERVYSAFSIGISRPVIIRDTLAKNGRVTGGIVSEVSLVDFPANPQCLAKLVDENGDDIQKVFGIPGTTIRKADGDGDDSDGTDDGNGDEPMASCPTCHGDGKIKGNSMTCPDCDGKGKVPADKAKTLAAEIAKDQLSPRERGVSGAQSVDGGVALAEAIKLAGNGRMDEALSKLREAVDADLEAERPKNAALLQSPVVTPVDPNTVVTAGAMGESASQVVKNTPLDPAAPIADPIADPALAAAGTPVGAAVGSEVPPTPPAPVALKTLGVGTQFKVRQLHDALCPAYSWDAVTMAHPSLKSNLASTLSPETASLLSKLEGDNLSCAYSDLLTFIMSPAAEEIDESVLESIRADLYKAFEMDYPTVTSLSPLTLDAADAGRWHRSYVSSDRATPFGTTTHVPIPEGHGTHPAGSDFTRGPLTADHERPSPEHTTGAPNVASSIDPDLTKRTFYTNANKETARGVMSDLHDHIAATFPDLCPTGPTTGFVNRSLGGTANDSNRILGELPQPIAPTPMSPPVAPHITPTSVDGAAREPGGVYSRDGGSHPIPVNDKDPDNAGNLELQPPAGDKSMAPELIKAALTADLPRLLEPEITKALGPVVTMLEELTKRVETVESGADPAQAPWRGASLALDTILKTRTRTAEDEAISTIESARFEGMQERVEYLLQVSKSPMSSPEQRDMARQQLNKMING